MCLLSVKWRSKESRVTYDFYCEFRDASFCVERIVSASRAIVKRHRWLSLRQTGQSEARRKLSAAFADVAAFGPGSTRTSYPCHTSAPFFRTRYIPFWRRLETWRLAHKMRRRIEFGYWLLFFFVSRFCLCSAFYLPGLAPVSFCEVGKGDGDCQVGKKWSISRFGHDAVDFRPTSAPLPMFGFNVYVAS